MAINNGCSWCKINAGVPLRSFTEHGCISTIVNFCPQCGKDLRIDKEIDKKIGNENGEERVKEILSILPCKIGDAVWFNTFAHNGTEPLGYKPHIIKNIDIKLLTENTERIGYTELNYNEVGKTIFFEYPFENRWNTELED